MKIFYNLSTLYTPQGRASKKGSEMKAILSLPGAVVGVEGGKIAYVGTTLPEGDHELIDCEGTAMLPGFVDSHTHAVFLGERSKEFVMRAAGSSYQQIAESGGGIRSSVRCIREAASVAEITEAASRVLLNCLSFGSTTIEVKSGYGLSTASELLLLEAIKQLSDELPMHLVATYLGAHAVPEGMRQSDYVESVISEQLPAIAAQGIANYCDVFCDHGYFTNEETARISAAAHALGLKIRLHADELSDTGGAALAVNLGAASADHLLCVSDAGIAALASSSTIATLLPLTALSLRAPYAPARKLIEAGAAVAIATDCNPGSSMSENLQLAMTLGVIGMQMTAAEAMTAVTLNGAAALGLAERKGSVEIGKDADFLLFDIPSLEYLPYHIGVSDLLSVIIGGEVVYGLNL